MQTINLTAMTSKCRDVLKNSTRIHDFCMEKYGIPPTLFVGVNGKKLPDERYCPAIVLLPGIKREGLETDSNEYVLGLMWSVKNGKVLVDGVEREWSEKLTGNVIEFVGVSETDELGQIIYEELAEASPNYPVGKSEFNIETQESWPQWPGFMFLTYESPVVLGGYEAEEF